MQSVHTQSGARKRSASSRWLGLRLIVNSFPVEMLREELRNPHDEAPPPWVTSGQATTFDLPLDDAADAATGGKTLDDTALSSLRGMFLLLDEWDHRSQETAPDSLEECVPVVDSKIK
ncbi:MAG: hypothetical protein ACRD3T_04080 [Terriglobia bacterium]